MSARPNSCVVRLLAAGNATAIVRDLGNPDDLSNFLFKVVAVPVLVSGIVADIAATVQNYRYRTWLADALAGVLLRR